jgi:geranylgeranyl diphosphate synthase type II
LILEDYLAAGRQRIDETLHELLPAAGGPAGTVAAAMRYAVLGGGKRLRPILVLAACEACGGDPATAAEPAGAVEMLHTYSLIHDDLPAMDDDSLRRGRPTVHRQFGEAEAILAGDALHSLAFEILAARPSGDAAAPRRLEAVFTLTRCAGVGGMVGGQIADIEAERSPVDGERLRWIHRHKTGALFAASAEIGAIHAGAASPVRTSLARFGRTLGLAFQITDDILDCTSTSSTLGKTPGKDASSGKATYPGLLGLEASREEARRLSAEARGCLTDAGIRSPVLEAMAEHATVRTA